MMTVTIPHRSMKIPALKTRTYILEAVFFLKSVSQPMVHDPFRSHISDILYISICIMVLNSREIAVME